MKIGYTTSTGWSTATATLGAFVMNSITMMLPWFTVMFSIIIADLIAGVVKCLRLGIDVSVSTAVRETLQKCVTYFAVVVTACLLDVAAKGNASIAKWVCLVVITIEGGSVISNILKPHGVEISLAGFLRMIFKRSPLNPTDAESGEIIKEDAISEIRDKEKMRWQQKQKRKSRKKDDESK